MAGFDASLAVNAAFDTFGVSATYTPDGGPTQVPDIKVVRVSEGDVRASWGQQTVIGRSDVFEIRASEVAIAPTADATIVIGAQTFKVKVDGTTEDADRLIWTVEAPLVA